MLQAPVEREGASLPLNTTETFAQGEEGSWLFLAHRGL